MQQVKPVTRVLRILSGPHSGAEMSLRPGRYVIGTDQDCDIVLSDSSLAAQHAVLQIDRDSVVFEPMDGDALGSAGPIDQRTQLSNYDPVVIGGTALAIGPENGAWPTIKLPNAKPVEESSADLDGHTQLDPVREAPSATISGAATARVNTAQPKRLALPRSQGVSTLVVVGVGVLILLSLLLGLHAVDSTDPDHSTEASAQQPLEAQVKSIVAGLDFTDDLEIKKGSRGGQEIITVSGYVATEDDRRQLLSKLQSFRQAVQVQVWSTDLLRSSVQQALSGMQIPLQVTSVDNGVVVLSGVLDGSSPIDTLESSLKRDVPGIAALTLQVANMSNAVLWLRQQAQQRSISTERLSFKPNADLLTVTGQLEDEEKTGWDAVTSGFKTKFENEITLLDQVGFAPAAIVENAVTTAPEPTPVKFNFTVRAINVGPPGYVTMASGEKYLVGSRLSNGMILDSIETGGMVLLDGDKKHMVWVASNSGEVTKVTEVPKQ